MKKQNNEHWRVRHLRVWMTLGVIGEVMAVACLTLLCAVENAWSEWPELVWDATLLVGLLVVACWWIGEGEERK